MKSALVVGGTGQTGPQIVEGLLRRGYEVVVLHAGLHEASYSRRLEHIHTDAHFPDPLAKALAGRTFEVAICTYGRTRIVAEALRGKTGRLITVSGTPIYRLSRPNDPAWGPAGLSVVDERSPHEEDSSASRLGILVRKTEDSLMAMHAAGDFNVSIFRYGSMYGPRSNVLDWSVVKRVLDGRKRLIVADAGMRVLSHAYTDNAAHAVLLAVDEPVRSAGQAYQVADDDAFITVGQRMALMAKALGTEVELVDMPQAVVDRLYPGGWGWHRFTPNTKMRDELGYRDLVPAGEAIQRTARWWAENPPDAEMAQRVRDRFDYALEDRVIAAYEAGLRDVLHEIDVPPPESAGHTWRHPTRENQESTPDESKRMTGAGYPFPYRIWPTGDGET